MYLKLDINECVCGPVQRIFRSLLPSYSTRHSRTDGVYSVRGDAKMKNKLARMNDDDGAQQRREKI